VSGETPPPEDQKDVEEQAPEAATTPEPEAAAEQPAETETSETEPTAEADAPAEAESEADAPAEAAAATEGEDDAGDEETAPREKPAIPGMDLEVDIVMDGDPDRSPYGDEEDLDAATEEILAAADEDDEPQPITSVAIDLKAGARYTATGKRKSAIARVILTPGTGAYTINGKTLNEFFPRPTLQRNIRQPLEAVGFEERMDVIARMEGGGVSAQAGALRHGISRALLEADPNLRGELKRRGFLTRDARAKERKKAGLKKARKRPQFSKR
jgi:small subunit ribosomal protein S9